MDKSARSSRLVTTLAVSAVSIAAVAAAVSAWAGRAAGPQRPPADARVHVVKAPPQPVVDRLPAPCPTCTMGGPGRLL